MIARHEAALTSAVDAMEGMVGSLGGSLWTYGNIAVVVALDYMEYRASHLAWRERAPKLAAWHGALAETSEYRETYAYEAV